MFCFAGTNMLIISTPTQANELMQTGFTGTRDSRENSQWLLRHETLGVHSYELSKPSIQFS